MRYDEMHYPRIHQPAWELIDTYEDTDDTTSFDYDSGNLSVIYNVYKLIYQLQAGDYGTLFMRLNGDASDNYAYTHEYDGSITNTTGDNKIHLGEKFGGQIAVGEIVIRGGNMVGTALSNEPTVTGTPPAGASCLLRGRLAVDYADVYRIRIWDNTGAGTGRLHLYGLNF